MAGNKLSLAIAINLLTENFKKGKNNVVSGLKSMQVRVMTFIAALGFGSIGLSNFVSKLISVAKETGRVTTALKNVSGGLANYAANQKFVNELAAKYGLEVNALTSNFAKFTASATAGGMALENQKKIFESVSRASTAFALSAEDTNSVFLALSQMMGKGKIASQELRLQMGEKLPVAIQAMANALGVSIAQMEKMMGKGELIANDVLPKFADALNALTPSVDLDNINTSLNKMSNAFGDLTTNLGVESKFKKIVDGVTSVMQSAANNLKGIFQALALGVVFFAVAGITKVGSRFKASLLERATGAEALAQKLKAIELKATIELNKLEDLRTQHRFASGQRRIRLAEQVAAQETKYAKIQVDISRQQAALDAANSQKKLGLLGNFSATATGLFSKIGASLKALWNSFLPAIIITGLLSIVNYFKNIYDESKKIKNIFSDYQKEISNISTPQEVVKLQSLYNISKSLTRSVDDRKNALAELSKQLNLIQGKNETDLDFQERINAKIKERAILLEATARADKYTQQKIEAEDNYKAKKKELGFEGIDDKFLQPAIDHFMKYNKTGDKRALQDGVNAYSGVKNRLNIKHVPGYQGMLEAMANYKRVINDASKNIENELSKTITPDTITPKGTGDDDKETELSKLESKYAQSLRELDVKLQAKFITEADYQKALEDLVKSSYVEAKSSTDKTILASKYLKNLENEVLNIKKADELQQAVNEATQSHIDEETKLTNLKSNGVINEETYNEKMIQLIDKTITQIGSMSDLTDANKEYIKTLQQDKDKIKKPLPTKDDYKEKKEKRDTTFDYKKTKIDIQSEELDVAKKNYATLKELASENLKEFEVELTSMMSNIKGLDEALKLAQVREDIKELNKEVTRGTLATADSMVSGVNNVVQSIQRINDAFSSTDASGWERIMALWEGIMSTVDSFLQIIDLIERLSQVTQMLTTAKETEAAMDTATTAAKIANMTAETAAVNAAVAEQTVVETTASTIKKTAATGEMAAKSTAAYASIPFAGPALAAAQIAAFTAMIAAASIPKFKDGGIIGGGATSGDQILARVNAGEMILNKPQQGNLWKMLNSTSRVRGESLEVGGKVRGADIHLALKNYMRSTGKTL